MDIDSFGLQFYDECNLWMYPKQAERIVGYVKGQEPIGDKMLDVKGLATAIVEVAEQNGSYEDFKYRVIEGIDLKTFTLRPHHVLVRWLKKEETRGGILIPENRQRKMFMVGIVLKTGPSCFEELKPGQKVQFNSLCDKEFLGQQDPADRDPVFCMVDDEVRGIVSEHDGKTEFVPTGDLVLIRPDEGPKEINGLTIPDPDAILKANMASARNGVIVSTGQRVQREPKLKALELSPGCRISYDPTVSDEVFVNGQKLVLVRADYVLGVLEVV